MKKIIALLLVAVMCLSLVACGNSKALNKNDTSNYIGVWQSEHFRLTVTKGGVGTYENLISGTEKYDLEWEVTDEVIVIRISGYAGMEHKAVLELNEDMTSLVTLQNGFPVFVEGEDTFIKK